MEANMVHSSIEKSRYADFLHCTVVCHKKLLFDKNELMCCLSMQPLKQDWMNRPIDARSQNKSTSNESESSTKFGETLQGYNTFNRIIHWAKQS